MNWLASIQERYEVNPWVFALIYLVTLPPGWYGTYRMVLALRQGRPSALRRWATLVAAMVVAPYLYVVAAGRNLPWWLYPLLACLAALSGWEVFSRVRRLGRGANREAERGKTRA